ncbi:hypothetical protein KBC04_03515 [Candidatus Babeliales bacterium]|nr:hypothetical protein [Candidatus Babeliales bacterium]MBP9843880.1 hypothetical protein [Candidatus Babeliales bacterium]
MVEQSIKKIFMGLAIVSGLNIFADTTPTMSKNFFQPRAFSANIAREMLMQGSTDKQKNEWFVDFSATGAYQRSWTQNTGNPSATSATANGLGIFPFWSGSNLMLVGGAQNVGVSFDLDAYQFGLGLVTTNGGITLDPIVYQTGADFMLVIGSSNTESGFFAKIKAPLGVYNMNPNLTEVLPALPTSGDYPVGALEVSTSSDPLPAQSMTQAFAGNLSNGQLHQGDFMPMEFGLIKGQISTSARFADIEMTAGYNVIFTHDANLSIGIRASAPTGNKATAQHLLEPIFGRGGYWGLGGYLASHVHIWEGQDENYLMFKFMGNVMHLFSIDTIRSYDLIANGAGSKYLLVADYSGDAYQSSIQNLINYSTLSSQSSYAVEGDVAAGLTYVHQGLTFDLGYEFFGRSAEKLEITGQLAEQTFAVLGNQAVAYFPSGAQDVNACQPLAAMNIASAAAVTTPPATDAVVTSQSSVVNATVPTNRISGNDALNLLAAQQAAYLTSKIFSQISYQWTDSRYVPHFGIMGEFEISNCNNNALPQWSVALIGGLQF